MFAPIPLDPFKVAPPVCKASLYKVQVIALWYHENLRENPENKVLYQEIQDPPDCRPTAVLKFPAGRPTFDV